MLPRLPTFAALVPISPSSSSSCFRPGGLHAFDGEVCAGWAAEGGEEQEVHPLRRHQ